MKTLGLIGVGKWGKIILNTLEKLPVNVITAGRLDWYELIHSKKCDGIIIATPPNSHIKIATEALKLNLPIMIEKPLSLKYQEALQLKEYETKAPILINHLHLFSPAIEELYKIINTDDIVHIRSVGINIGPFRDYSALFDYGSHDVSMGLYLTRSVPSIEFVYCHKKQIEKNTGCTFEIELDYFQRFKHRITVGNAGPQKTRLLEIKTTKNNLFIYNDLKDNKLYVNGSSIELSKISTLENSLWHFIKSIEGYTDNRFGLDIALKTTKILEECYRPI